MDSGPLQCAGPWTQSTWIAPLLPTTNTSVWLGTPNCAEAASPAPGGAPPVGETATGPLHEPPPWIQSTCVAPLFPTTNTSVWLGMPNCWETASLAPGG